MVLCWKMCDLDINIAHVNTKSSIIQRVDDCADKFLVLSAKIFLIPVSCSLQEFFILVDLPENAAKTLTKNGRFWRMVINLC